MKNIGIILFIFFISFILHGCKESKSPTEPGDQEAVSIDISVGPAGGTFIIDNNTQISIPDGALPSETELTIACLQEQHWQDAFYDYETDEVEDLAAFSISPATTQFARAVMMRFKSVDSNPTTIPLTHTVDLTASTHVVDSTVTIIDHTNDSLTVAVHAGGTYIVEANYAWASLAKVQGTSSCREGLIIVETSDHDVQCTVQNCQISESKVRVQFLSCDDQPVESAILREASASCSAVMNLSAASSAINTNSNTQVHAMVEIGCMAVEDQEVSFSETGVGRIDPQKNDTNADGIATTTFYAEDEEGTATVTAEAEVRYPIREIIINDSVIEAFYRTDPVSGSTDITVQELPTWHIELDVALVEAPHNWVVLMDYVNYTAHVEADLSIDTTAEYGAGHVDLNGSQSLGEITVQNLVPGLQVSTTVVGTHAPSPFPCRISGYYDNDYGTIEFFVTHQGDEADFATWDIEIRYVDDLQPPHILQSFIGGFWACGGLGITFEFPADAEQYTTSGCMTTVTYDGTYTMTVSRK
jgi:hypothetical protein